MLKGAGRDAPNMADEEAHRGPWWIVIAVAIVLVSAMGLYFATRDPMLLIFGGIAAVAVGFLAFLALASARGSVGPPPSSAQILVKCTACGHANPEEARYCNKCGKGLGPA